MDETADYLSTHLAEAGVESCRLDTDAFTEGGEVFFSTKGFGIKINGSTIYPCDVHNVWYRRPTLLTSPCGDSPEMRFTIAEWSEALEGFLATIPFSRWVNHPSANARSSHKLDQLTTAAKLGFEVPDSLVTRNKQEIYMFWERHKESIIAKPLSPGYIKRQNVQDSLLYTNKIEVHDVSDLPDFLHCPTLFQQMIEKKSDVRITVLDDAIHAIELKTNPEDSEPHCDIRYNNMNQVMYKEITLPPEVDAKVRLLMKKYRLRFAAIDMAVTRDGNWIFFEINPNGQWAWLDIKAGANLAMSFVQSFTRVPHIQEFNTYSR